MKILYFSSNFGAPTTTFIRNETEHFSKEHDIKYICNDTYSDITIPDYVEVIPFNENRIVKKIKWYLWKADWRCDFKNKKFREQLNKTIHSFNPDIIHCHFGYEALMLLDNLDKLDERKIILHFHGYDATSMTRKNSYVNRLKFFLEKNNIYTISCNHFFIEKFKTQFKINISHAFVLKCGINIDTLFNLNQPLKNTLDYEYIIQVSSLVEKKGHEYTIRAFALLLQETKYKNLKLLITGEGQRKMKILDLVKQLKLENNVEFIGLLSPTEVASYLSQALVFVHHSVTDSNGDMEGIPNTIMEAMALKLPIVSTIHSGIPELVEDGVNGYLVKERDVETYALRLKDALKMGRINVNREKICNEYNLEIHNKLLFDFYVKCLEN